MSVSMKSICSIIIWILFQYAEVENKMSDWLRDKIARAREILKHSSPEWDDVLLRELKLFGTSHSIANDPVTQR